MTVQTPTTSGLYGLATASYAGSLKRWSATIVATVASTYALDTVATAAGVVLVTSGLLSGLDLRAAAGVLALSYLLWAVGLTKSLRANWRLLEATGTSTSAPSKFAYDLAGRLNAGIRLRRCLSAAGYVAFELAKESPYYIGAFGLAVVSDTVSGQEALLFLAGANAGAAAYEYGLAWSTGVLLRKAGPARYASFENEWAPAAYLADYYTAVGADERATIAFFTAAARRMPLGEPALVFGAGPTLHHVFLLARHAPEIHLGDYLRGNLDEIARWLGKESGAHDWRPFVAHTLRCEGVTNPAGADVRARERLTRERVTALLEVDVRNDRPLGSAGQCYGTVVSAYCADSVTDVMTDWDLYMRRIIGLVRPGGTLLVAALGRTRRYLVDGKSFPSPGLDAADIERLLSEHFPQAQCTIEVVAVPECAPHGYSRIILAAAHAKGVR